MDDAGIIALYWQRSEQAIAETDSKYGAYCYRIAHNILENSEDAEESVSDTYMAAWKSIPPHRPAALAVFLGKITRNLSISRWRARCAGKRGGGELVLALEELGECVPCGESTEFEYIRRETAIAIHRFLDRLPVTERKIFLRRYWYLESVGEIAACFGFSRSKVTSMLHRTRAKLRLQLEKEGFV